MALPEPHPLFERLVTAHMADISTAGSSFAVFPCRGEIVKLGSVIYNAITGADAIITTRIAGVAIAGGGWTVSQSGSAAGDVDEAVPTGATAGSEGQNIEFVSDGASSTACPATFFALIRVK